MDEGSREYYRRLEEEFDETALTQRVYRESTEGLFSWLRKLWYSYCEFTDKDPMQTLVAMPISVLNSFFHWLLRQRSNTLRSSGTLQTYWNVFCLMRKKETGCFQIDQLIKSQMHGVRQRLAIEFKLNTEKKAKPIMRAEDEFELLKTLWTLSDMTFVHERHRLQLALIIQLAGITGSRPAALLALQYQHIRVTLLPDPLGGEQPRVVIEIDFKHTKGYLGEKDPNTLGIPDVPREPCLLLCPQITFLSIAFADEAFAGPLESPEQFFSLYITPGLKQQVVPWKDSMLEKPVFRRSVQTVYGSEVSPDQPLSDHALRDRLRTLGEVTGLELPVGPYCFRRGNGEALDSSSNISESQRNLILQHSDSRVFQKNYASRYITADTQAAYRRLEPQIELMRAASGMSRTIDQRRPRKLNKSQFAEVDRHPEVKLLLRRRTSLRKYIKCNYGPISHTQGSPIYQKYIDISRDYRNKRRKIENMLLMAVKAKYKKEQPVIDIERQLIRGQKMEEQTHSEDQIYLLPERLRAIDALLQFATKSPEEEIRRRVEAIDALTALSKLHEGWRLRHGRRTRTASMAESEEECKPPAKLRASLSDSIPIECKPTQCIFCLGLEGLSNENRLKEFGSKGDLKKHFLRKHLRHYKPDEPLDCPHPRCRVSLDNPRHLRSHAQVVHKTPT